APTHPHVVAVTVRGAQGHARPAELTLPDGYDDYPRLAGTPIQALAHAYSAIRDDLVLGTAVAPDFVHAVTRHRLLDAIERSAVTGRRVTVDPASVRAAVQPSVGDRRHRRSRPVGGSTC
ncbi:hypothetical protein CFP66_42085, partial [Pseudonocardia sp. MH-G8]